MKLNIIEGCMMKRLFIVFCVVFMVACSMMGHSDEEWLKNTQNEALYVKVDGLENASQQKLVFIQHGLASNLNHQAVQAAKRAFLAKGYVVVTFDSRYSLGNSGNAVPFVRLSTFEEDLQTVTAWAKTQPFYSEPFALAGHSLGGASVLQYSAMYPQKVSFLVPITPLISGERWEQSCMQNLGDFCKQWKKKGSFSYTDAKNHKTAAIPYAVVTDSKAYNAYALAPRIKAKTLVVAAEQDNVIYPDDVKKLANQIHGEAVVVPLSGHNFEDKANQADLYKAISEFLK